MQDLTPKQLEAMVTAAYVGPSQREGYAAAVVLELDERIFPRKQVRNTKRERGGWPRFATWAFSWDERIEANVTMGDAPADVLDGWIPFPTEEEAREQAREWVGPEGKDVPYRDLPYVARSALHYGHRSGFWAQ